MPTESRTAPIVDVVVVGAGVAGLTVAHRLSGMSQADGRTPRVTVLESAEHIGGLVETCEREGFLIERGPDSMITEKPWGLQLCREVGLEADILPTNAALRRSFIARGTRLYPVPEGFHLIAPSRLLPFACSSLLSWKGKLRVALEPLVGKGRDMGTDESLASFVRRRLGREALERIAQPMVGGIYTADPARLSLRATLPRFQEMESRYGSVVRGLMATRLRATSAVASASGPRYDLFVGLRQGMQQLPRALADALPEGVLRTRTRAVSMARRNGRWLVTTDRGEIEARAVCLAIPSYASAALLQMQCARAARELDAIEYASTATVTLAYRRKDIAHPLDGFGFVVPAIERRKTLACTFSSVKFPGRAPAGFVLLRTFVGGALFPDNFALDDESMVAAVQADMRDLIGARVGPAWTLVTRYPRSMPQYHVGHLERVSRIERALVEEAPGIVLAGNALNGAGIPDTIRSANRAAERIAEVLTLKRAAERLA